MLPQVPVCHGMPPRLDSDCVAVGQSRAPMYARAGAFPRVQAALAERRRWLSVKRADDPRIFPVGRGRLGSMRWAAIAPAEQYNRRI